MAFTAHVKWIDSDRFLGETGSGHAVVMEGVPGEGEVSIGVRPMELLLVGMGGCTAFDIVSILQKARQRVTGCEISVEGERADDMPRVYKRIHVHYTVTGHGLKRSAVERAIELSTEKYCSATIMMAATAEVTHDFEIVEAE